MKEFLEEQKELIEDAFEKLILISDKDASEKKNEKWSRKEILGHLIDSASVNHQRIIRAQFAEELIFLGYDQDDWVKAQNYKSASWSLLVELWKNYNLLILHAIDNIPEDILLRKRDRHNFDEIEWKPIDKKSPASLDYMIKDYFGHMYHHLKQIFNY